MPPARVRRCIACGLIGQISGWEGDVSQKPVFVTSEGDHEEIEDAEQDQADVVREAVAVKLVGDERA